MRSHYDRLAANLPTLRIYVLGFLANVLGLLTFIFLVYLCLATFSLFFTTINELARAKAAGALPANGSALELISDSVVGSARNALKGLWDARLGFLVFGVLGVFAAWAHQIGLVVHKKRAWLGSFICVAVIITVSIITWAFAQREEIALWIAESPETFRWRDLLLESYYVEVSVSLIFALSAAYLIWAVWRWWYVRLNGWLGSATLGTEPGPGVPFRGAEQQGWRYHTSHLHELKREMSSARSRSERPEGVTTEAVPPRTLTPLEEALQSGKLIKPLGILFVLCVLILFPVNRYHDQVAIRLQHGIVFVDIASRPHQEAMVRIEPDIHKIRVVNINGLGTVNLYLSPTADWGEAIESVKGWSFEWRQDEYIYTDVPVAGLEPGDYYLHFVQESGWGYFEYMLSHGGGTLSHLSVLVVGFLLACSLILGLALIFLGAMRLFR